MPGHPEHVLRGGREGSRIHSLQVSQEQIWEFFDGNPKKLVWEKRDKTVGAGSAV